MITRRNFLRSSAIAAAAVNFGLPLVEALGVGVDAGRLKSTVDEAIADRRIVGAVVLVSQDGAPVCRYAAGFADREAKQPMREDAIFRLASVSKLLTSVAAMALVEQGKMGLNDPVTRYLPEFRPHLKDGSEAYITVRQLLTHTAGLRYGFGEGPSGPYRKANVSTGLDQPGLSLGENLRRIASVPLDYTPGTGWGYSVATDVLGAVIAAACKQTLSEVVKKLVTDPLGMVDTGFSVTDRARLTVPYMDAKPQPRPMPKEAVVAAGSGAGIHFSVNRILDALSFPSGGAGMAGTAPDIMRLVDCLCRGGGVVLKAATVAQMNANQIAPRETEPGWGFGLGWGVLVDPARGRTPQSAGTAQWGGVYGHSWFFDSAKKLSAVALTNTTFAGMAGRFPNGIRDAVYSKN